MQEGDDFPGQHNTEDQQDDFIIDDVRSILFVISADRDCLMHAVVIMVQVDIFV